MSRPFYRENVEVVLQTGHGVILTKNTSDLENAEIDTFTLGINKLIILKIAADGTCSWTRDALYTNIIVPGLLKMMCTGTSVIRIRNTIKQFFTPFLI